MLYIGGAVQAGAKQFKTSIRTLQVELYITAISLNASTTRESTSDSTWPLTGIRNTSESSQVRNAIEKEHEVVLHGYQPRCRIR